MVFLTRVLAPLDSAAVAVAAVVAAIVVAAVVVAAVVGNSKAVAVEVAVATVAELHLPYRIFM